ncbi:MAG: 4'-phosphopantetheinyl transferase superfamily protein [Gemmatimonadota bacterium]
MATRPDPTEPYSRSRDADATTAIPDGTLTHPTAAGGADGLAAHVLRPPIVVVEGPVDPDDAALFPEESDYVARAVDVRRREFSTARRFAREAMARFGLPPAPLVPDENRAPVWPEGIVGSITHTREHCAVAVARRAEVASIGIDVETIGRASEGIDRLIMVPGEAEPWQSAGFDGPEVTALVFSAKEAFYKCQFPLTHRMLAFGDVRVRPSGDGGFTVVPEDVNDEDFDILRRCGQSGRWHISGGMVVTALAPTDRDLEHS